MKKLYTKFRHGDMKTYVPILDVFSRKSGRMVRLSKRMYKKAQPAQAYAERFQNRFKSLEEASYEEDSVH